MKCGKSYDFAYMKNAKGVPKCTCGGMIKPDVVLYEEGLDNGVISEAVRAISQAQVLIIGGTSLAVYPAAGLIDYFSGEHQITYTKRPVCGSSDQGAYWTGIFTDPGEKGRKIVFGNV